MQYKRIPKRPDDSGRMPFRDRTPWDAAKQAEASNNVRTQEFFNRLLAEADLIEMRTGWPDWRCLEDAARKFGKEGAI